MKVYMPIKTISEANRSRHEHWTKTRKRIQGQKDAAYILTLQALNEQGLGSPPWRTKFTRIAPDKLDPMVNLPGSMKAVEDGVCRALGIDDRHWQPECDQRIGRRGEYAVEVEIETDGHEH